VNLHKITVDLSGRTDHFLGSIGVQYLAGESGAIPLRALRTGQPTTAFKVNNVGLIHSLSVLL
jgi:hypothetical protein